MPLLMCPNDNSPMQEIDRNGVKIDVCPECRGVWLDRGELEKMLSLVEGEAQRQSPPRREEWREERRYDRDYDRDDDYRRKKRKKRFELFDFFD